MRYSPYIVVTILSFLSVSTIYGAATGTMSITGGSVGGNGAINGLVDVGAAGSVSPGATRGTLAISGDLDISAMAADGGAGALSFGLGALNETNDQITVSGELTIGVEELGFSDFVFTGLGGVEAGTYILITSTGITSGDSLDPGDLSGTFTAGNGMTVTGTIAISGNDINLVVSTPYSIWADTFLPGVDVSDPAENYDSDALVNLQEFAFGTDPTTSTGSITIEEGLVTNTNGLPIAYLAGITATTVDYRAVFSRRKNHVADGLTYTVEFSTLESGSPWVASGATPTVMDATDSAVDVVYVPYLVFIPTTNGFEKPRFFRVRVEFTPYP